MLICVNDKRKGEFFAIFLYSEHIGSTAFSLGIVFEEEPGYPEWLKHGNHDRKNRNPQRLFTWKETVKEDGINVVFNYFKRIIM